MVGNKNMSLLLLLCITLYAGFKAEALSYDYTASIECLSHPYKPQYNGGIIKNPELNNGLQGWIQFGGSKIEHRESLGNKYVVAHSRNQPYDSVSQKILLQKNRHYVLSAWIQVSKEINVPIKAFIKTTKGINFAGATIAQPNCWSMLKGGFTADTSGPAELYFESNNTNAEIWIDSVSLQPFTEKQWRSHRYQSIEKVRRRKVLVRILDEQGKPLPNASVSFVQNKPRFPFGSSIGASILNSTAYQNWFLSRFSVTTFGNEMKWYATEAVQGQENYALADAMLRFAQQHNVAVRGHNIFWDDPNFQTRWVPSLSPEQLSEATARRINSVVTRYRGQVIHWDVVNENMHFSFFESRLGPLFSSRAFSVAHRIDPYPTLFLNDYNTIEDRRDGLSSPAKYIEKLREIQRYPGNRGVRIGIGLEAHFPDFPPNLPYMRAAIDILAATGSPIWITELDVAAQPNQVTYFEQVLREAHSHPAVQGIVMWTGRTPQGCYRICLTDSNFRNYPAGDVVDKLLREWGLLGKSSSMKTNRKGLLEVSLFHGDYNLEINHPRVNKNHSFTVIPKEDHESKEAKQFVQVSTNTLE